MRLVDADELKLDLKWLECDTPVYHDVMSTIDERATVDPVKHGQWVVDDNHHTCRCSCCESVELTDWALDQARYCPHCGAKMDEVAE